MQNKKFLFIFGCPRSGTTVFNKLLLAHSKVLVGIERYYGVISREELTPSYFEKERFFRIESNDTHYDSFEFKEYQDFLLKCYQDKYQDVTEYLVNKYDQAIYIGDKNPNLHNHINQLKKFNEYSVTIVFLIRNIFDVALSFQRRYNSPTDNWDRESITSIREWNKSINIFLNLQKESNYNLLCVDYDSLFTQFYSETERQKYLTNIFNQLNLDINNDILNYYQLLSKQFATLEKRRLGEYLPLETRLEISKKAAFGLYRQCLQIGNNSLINESVVT